MLVPADGLEALRVLVARRFVPHAVTFGVLCQGSGMSLATNRGFAVPFVANRVANRSDCSLPNATAQKVLTLVVPKKT